MPGTCQDVWKNCLTTIAKEVEPEKYTTLFEPIQPLSLHEETLTIRVPSQYYHHELENNYAPLLKKVISSEIGVNAQLLYNIVVDNTITIYK